MRPAVLAAPLALLCACVSPQVAVNPRADFAAIHRVAVSSFAGPGGEAAADLLAQSLIARGAEVVERRGLDAALREAQLSASGLTAPSTAKKAGKILGVDAIFVGTVIENSPASSYLVTSSKDPAEDTVTKVSGGSTFSQGPVTGLPNSRLITTAARVNLLARMVEVETGSVMWSASMRYEGFDAAAAMAAITDSFADSLAPIWPALEGRKR